MEEFIERLDRQHLSGIPIVYWRRFLKIFAEGITEQQAHSAVDRLSKGAVALVDSDSQAAEAITALCDATAQLIAGLSRMNKYS